MIHDNKDEFLNILERTAGQTGFSLWLLEKDYYIFLKKLIYKNSANFACKDYSLYYNYFCRLIFKPKEACDV